MNQPVIYARPKTRGDLRDNILNGIESEVVTSNVSITQILIDYWLGVKGKYKVRPSENQGWSIFYPTPEVMETSITATSIK